MRQKRYFYQNHVPSYVIVTKIEKCKDNLTGKDFTLLYGKDREGYKFCCDERSYPHKTLEEATEHYKKVFGGRIIANRESIQKLMEENELYSNLINNPNKLVE